MFKIIIIDDDAIVRISLKTILSQVAEILSIGENADEAITLYKTHNPDLIMLDIRMGNKTGVDAAREILKYDNSAKVLFLTTFSDDEYLQAAIEIGASGYILKQDFENIYPAIEAVMKGHRVFGNNMIDKITTKTTESDLPKFGLSQKEIEFIRLVANGKSNKEISTILYLSEGTVRNYLSLILEKLDLRDRTQLAIFYYKH